MKTTPGFKYEDRTLCVCGIEIPPQSKRIEKKFAWGSVFFGECSQCGTKLQSPQITSESLAAWYDSQEYQSSTGAGQGPYFDYLAEEGQRQVEALVRYRRDLVWAVAPGARVLEVGCSTGSLLKILRDEGHEVEGVELSASFAVSARELNGLEVHIADLAEYDHEVKSLDLVIMLGTFSNISNLPRQLARVHSWLKDDGLLYFNVPSNSSVAARLYGASYWMYAPSVVNFLSMNGVEQVLDGAGFEIEKCRLDRQQPTVARLLSHLSLHHLYPLASKLGFARLQVPVSLPIPGVSVFWARPKNPTGV